MGFLKKLKRDIQREVKKAKTPDDCIYWQGWYIPVYHGKESLSNDIDTLRKMRMYYASHNYKESNKDEIIKEIVLKANELVKNGAIQEYEWVSREMVELFGTQEEKVEFAFSYFLRRLKTAHFTKEDIAIRNTKKGSERNILVYDYHYDSKYQMIEKLPEYYEAHLDELIEVVWGLIEEEKQGKSLLYIGFYLYEDLMNFVEMKKQNPNHSFSNKVWQKTYAYLQLAHKEYDCHQNNEFMKSNKNFDLSYCEELNYQILYARRALELLHENKLLKEWLNYPSYIKQKEEKNLKKEYTDKKNEYKEEKPVIIEKEEIVAEVVDEKVRAAEESSYFMTVNFIEEIISVIEKTGNLDRKDHLLEKLFILGDVSYYEKLFSVLNTRIAGKYDDFEIVKKLIEVKVECENSIEKIKARYAKLTKEEKSFIQKNKATRINSIYILLYLVQMFDDKEEIVSAFETLEDYNAVLKDEDLYVYMADLAYKCMKNCKDAKEDYDIYEDKYISYLNKAVEYGHLDAQDILDNFIAFYNHEEQENAFTNALTILDDKNASIDDYKNAIESLDSILAENENEYILSKSVRKLENVYRALSDRKENYSFVYEKIVEYYQIMDDLDVEDAYDDLQHFITYVKKQEAFDEIEVLTDELFDYINNDEKFIAIMNKMEKFNEICQYDFIYMQNVDMIKDKLKNTSNLYYDTYQNMLVSYLEKAAQLGNKEAKDELKKMSKKDEKEESIKRAKQVLRMCDTHCGITLDMIDKFTIFFEEAKDKDLWDQYASYCYARIDHDIKFKNAYDHAMEKVNELSGKKRPVKKEDLYTKFKRIFENNVKPVNANKESVELLEDRLMEFTFSDLAFGRLDVLFELLEEVADVQYYDMAIEVCEDHYHYSMSFGKDNDYYKEQLDRLLAEKEALLKGLDLVQFAKEYVERMMEEE